VTLGGLRAGIRLTSILWRKVISRTRLSENIVFERKGNRRYKEVTVLFPHLCA